MQKKHSSAEPPILNTKAYREGIVSSKPASHSGRRDLKRRTWKR
jgi:hypothetical protein